MRIFGSVLILFLTFFISSCQNSDDILVPSENSENSSYIYSPEKSYSEEGNLLLLQNIDGNTGGTIAFDTSYVDSNGNSVSMSIKLKFLPKSFIGIKEIKIIPDLSTGSIQFFPHMQFSKDVLLELSYEGIDLSTLGFDSNSKADFVFQDVNGLIELVVNKKCSINWKKSLIFVNNAKLKHFSRYAFIRKSR